MTDKDEEKKESIDGILADLNDILSKMPSILDGVKTPESAPAAGVPLEEKPAESSCPPGTEPLSGRAEALQTADDRAQAADPAFREEPAPEPAPGLEEKPSAVPETMDVGGNFERIIDLKELGRADASGNKEEDTLSRPRLEADAGTAEDKFVLQTLGESMFSGGVEENNTGPAGMIKPEPVEPVRPDIAAPGLSADGSEPAPEISEIRTDALADLPAAEPETKAVAQSSEKDTAAEAKISDSPYAGTRDFGVPDIDMLMKMSQTGSAGPQVGEAPAAAQAEPPVECPVPQAEAVYAEEIKGLQLHEEGQSDDKPGDQDTGLIEPLAAEGGTVEFKEEDLKKEESAPLPAPGAGEEGIQLEPRIMAEPAGNLSPEQNASAGPAYPPAADLPAGRTGAEAAQEKTVVLEPYNQAGVEAAGENALVLEISNTGSVPSADAPAPQPEEEKTMLLVPAAASQSEEEKTVMYEAGAELSAARRSKGELNELSVKTAPDGIPEDRLRTLALLYMEEDKELCAEVLAELDAICLKSSAKPMFIKRGFVKVCETGMNGNYVLQMASDIKASGLLCVGSIPQETVYEIENVFSSSSMAFKHVQRDNFSHSAMLDLVTELILK
ncbi:MAG: hypothetical protein HY796_09960 [Elusimicrobia bacterium]|nr:hypothetical protein [Elusimicrobiota bacterium]